MVMKRRINGTARPNGAARADTAGQEMPLGTGV